MTDRLRYTLIDGVKCFSPEVAQSYSDSPDGGFDITDESANASFWVRSRNRLFKRIVLEQMNRGGRTRLLEIGVLPHVAERFLNHTPTGMLRVYAHAELWPERVEAAKAMERHLLDVVANGAPGYKTLLTDASAGAIF